VTAPLLVVSGTGTGIGKTHASAALLRAWARLLEARGVERPQVAGLKPVESGVSEGTKTDAATLEQASTFHVKRFPPPYMLTRAVSPHLAAADEGRTIELGVIQAYVADVREVVDGVAVELPGGLFSPLAPGLDNADVARALSPTALLLVAPDRLGVLHDVAAATRAAAACAVAITGIVVVAPEHPDASTGTNARELARVADVPVVATLPRADVATLSEHPDLAGVLAELLTKTKPRPRHP
jgi:dethiobiotin synthetase